MVTINTSLYIGSSALMAQQMAISTTGQNIANVNTPGYTRQRVNLVSTAIPSPLGPFGTGVDATGVVRIYDQFLNASLNGDIQQKNAWDGRSQLLTQVETIFTDTTETGLSQSLSKFWNAWQDLANNPSGYAERKAVADAGQNLAQTFQTDYNALNQIQDDADVRIDAAVGEINTLADQIGSLNDSIVRMERYGQNANDLRDQRDQLLNQLSEKIDFTYSENAEGRVTVTLGDNKELVGDASVNELAVATDASGQANVVWKDDAAGTPIPVSGGNLQGYLDVRNTMVPGYKDTLDTLASNLIDRVNTLHSAGTGLDESTGLDFFSGDSADTIAVNSAITGDVNQIAAAGPSTASDLVGGDNSQAVRIYQLQNTKITGVNGQTFDTYYNALVSKVGTDSATASSNLTQQTSIVAQMTNLRESISGVSTDEEMANLIQYQHGYAAAAKLIDTVSQMMDTVINMVR